MGSGVWVASNRRWKVLQQPNELERVGHLISPLATLLAPSPAPRPSLNTPFLLFPLPHPIPSPASSTCAASGIYKVSMDCFLKKSYAPKKTDPPIEIQNTRGWIPEKSFIVPSSAAILFIVSTMPTYGALPGGAPSISRVLVTSSGVVTAAANPPIAPPGTPLSYISLGGLHALVR